MSFSSHNSVCLFIYVLAPFGERFGEGS
ncbi:rCG53226 [Rattus norvegicus]|uniref:RCG53226 n=1 Tax=Rattus norvegicus TaxID=10116 RepID=A6JMD2_RAT|nr:rCG53226 [Rattus norvegicus]